MKADKTSSSTEEDVQMLMTPDRFIAGSQLSNYQPEGLTLVLIRSSLSSPAEQP